MRTQRPERARGMTFLELMVAISISSLIVIAMASLQHISALQIKNVFGQVHTRQTRMIALDQVRYRLMNARVGSCVVYESGHRIEFVDLNQSKVYKSYFRFIPSERKLYYNKMVGDGIPGVVVVKGPVDVLFTIEKQALVKIWVKSASNANYGEVDTQDGMIKVQLRTANSAS